MSVYMVYGCIEINIKYVKTPRQIIVTLYYSGF